MNKPKLIGFINDRYAVWYSPINNCLFCEALNMHVYGVHNIATAYEKAKTIFINFKIAE